MTIGIHFASSAEETHRLGKSLGECLEENAIVALFGELGAGKTTFVRGLAEGFGRIDPCSVSSPTFNFLNIYKRAKIVYHFDLYRLPREEEFFAAGFDEYFLAGGVCCVEWAEKIQEALPARAYLVHFSYCGPETRQLEIVKKNT
jgi:tRNA threonylcarbamoyladenosine biosynthesis protein TsaE